MGSYDGRLLIANQRLQTKDKIAVENPATLELLGEAYLASSEDCRRAVEAAKEAFPLWRALPTDKKQRFFLAARDILLRRADEIAQLITSEKGSPISESLAVEVLTVLEALDYYGHSPKRALSPKRASAHVPFFGHKKNAFLFQPLGPTLIISPWNFPFMLPFCDVISALTTSNTVILRPSTSTPFSALAIGEIFLEAGLPPGVLNIVPCRVAQAEELIQNPEVQSIVFTGSVLVGKRIMALASRNLTSLVLELGGKDPMIVLKDANLEESARGAVWAGFMNTGQSCASVERVYVASEIADKFLEKVVGLTEALRVGNPIDSSIDIGPMENRNQLKVVEEHVRDAVEKGARILCGGRRLETLPGYFYLPTVLNGVNHSMKVMTEETFGPVLPVMPFSNVEEAVALANDSRYGLTASVWTRDKKAASRVAEQLEVGTVTVNDHMCTFSEPRAIWGGVKQTGFGRTHGPYGLLELVNIKYISADFAGKPDRMWWYPYSLTKLQILENSLRLLHHRRRSKKARALFSLVPRLGAIKGGMPFRSLLRVSSRLFRT
jgi:acyl-CoA reductase-like NAD-dependent aldehyde dehydrogenase